jgi:hypothetical protein
MNNDIQASRRSCGAVFDFFFHPLKEVETHKARATAAVITNLFITAISLGLWQIPFWVVNRLDQSKITVTMTDGEIIANLVSQGFAKPIEKGSDGRCLFQSIAPQITDDDLYQAKIYDPSFACTSEKWTKMNLQEQADLLRKWAMAEEAFFFSKLPEDYESLSPEKKTWIQELYKDMLQQIEGLPASAVPQRCAANNDSDKFLYCKQHFQQYLEETSTSTNWAGTSEVIALSRVFQRDARLFGRNLATSFSVRLSDGGYVLPYFETTGKRVPPITIFQCNGGGHYKLLPIEPF